MKRTFTRTKKETECENASCVVLESYRYQHNKVQHVQEQNNERYLRSCLS